MLDDTSTKPSNDVLKRLKAVLDGTAKGEPCEKHPHKRKIEMDVNGEKVFKCPICASDDMARQLAREMQAENAQNAARRILNVYATQSIVRDENVLTSRFKQFEHTTEFEEDVYNKTVKAGSMIVNDGRAMKLWFMGHTGRGKTHLAAALLNRINSTGKHTCLFIDVDKLFKKIQHSFNDVEAERMEVTVQRIIDADFVLFDDIGAEVGDIDTKNVASDFKSNVLRDILNGRKDKTSLFTTNLTIADFERIYDGKVVSRAFEDAAFIMFDNAIKDKRRKIIEL